MLTLQDAGARRAALCARLDGFGLDYELFFGIDGRNGLPARWEAHVDRAAAAARMRRRMTDGELACALSHQQIYRTIVERDLPAAVILEDDALIGPAFDAFLRMEDPEREDLLMLDHSAGRLYPFRWRRTPDGRRAYRFGRTPDLTTGYLLTYAGARWIRTRSQPVAGVADWPCDISQMNAAALVPRLVDHPAASQNYSVLATHRDDSRRHRLESAKSPSRRLTAAYWKRKWMKLRTVRLDNRVDLG